MCQNGIQMQRTYGSKYEQQELCTCMYALTWDWEHVHVWLQQRHVCVCVRESVPQSCLCLPLAAVGGLTQTAQPLSKSKWNVCVCVCVSSGLLWQLVSSDYVLMCMLFYSSCLSVHSLFGFGLTDILSSITHLRISLPPLRVFGFVAKKPGSVVENVCHLFAELDPEQPATAIVNFINKVMLAPQRR